LSTLLKFLMLVVINPEHNHLAQNFANEHDLAGTVGSDAHILFEIGQATLSLPYFEGADGLRKVIRQGRQIVQLSPAWVHLGSGLARLYKALCMGMRLDRIHRK